MDELLEELMGTEYAHLLHKRSGRIACCIDGDVGDILHDTFDEKLDDLNRDIEKLEKFIDVESAMDDPQHKEIAFANGMVKIKERDAKAISDLLGRISATPTCEYLERTGKLPTECGIE